MLLPASAPLRYTARVGKAKATRKRRLTVLDLARMGGKAAAGAGGRKHLMSLTPAERTAQAKRAAKARWGPARKKAKKRSKT